MTTIPCVHFDLQSEEWPAACLRFVVFYYPFLYTWLGSEQPMISWARCWTATSHGGRQRNCTIMSQCVRILFEFIIHNISFDIVDSFIHSFVRSFIHSLIHAVSQAVFQSVAQPCSCVSHGMPKDFPVDHPSPIAAFFLTLPPLRRWALLVSWLIMNHWNWKDTSQPILGELAVPLSQILTTDSDRGRRPCLSRAFWQTSTVGFHSHSFTLFFSNSDSPTWESWSNPTWAMTAFKFASRLENFQFQFHHTNYMANYMANYIHERCSYLFKCPRSNTNELGTFLPVSWFNGIVRRLAVTWNCSSSHRSLWRLSGLGFGKQLQTSSNNFKNRRNEDRLKLTALLPHGLCFFSSTNRA